MTLDRGHRLGRYEIVAPLGAGGMGEVYRARDARLERDVAIKVLPEAMAKDPELRLRFEREAKAVAALTHPNILEIYDFAWEGETAYAVAELLDGETLRARINRGDCDWRTAIKICASIADGLAAAHKQAIVHRDLKPENVFLTSDDQVKILDFGLAKILHPEVKDEGMSQTPTGRMETSPGFVMGTAGYMSPEQVRGKTIDHRTDIFALGCVLYELLCGQRAFSGDSYADVASAILNRQPTSLLHSGCVTEVDVNPIIDRCLEKSPNRRFQNASDLAFALRSLISSSGSRGPLTALGRPRKWRWIFAVGLAVVAIISAVIWLPRRPKDQPEEISTGLRANLVAVAPFQNRTGRDDLTNLGAVAADWLTNVLARIDAIDVVPSGLGFGTTGVATSPNEVADASGAGIVVTGFYFLEGDTLRFQATLTDAIHGALLHSLDPITGPVDQPMISIEALGSEVAGAVASFFSSWDASFDQNIRPPSFEAYREYMAGMELFAVDNQKALEHFNRAFELDPDFVAPQLLAVSVLKESGNFTEARAIIDHLSNQRQSLNPFERYWLEYHTALVEGDNQRAVLQARRCKELAPRSALITFALARNLLVCACPREALEVVSSIGGLAQWSGAGPCAWPFSLQANAQHVLGFYDDELQSVRQGTETCGDTTYLQSSKARALIGKGDVDRVEEVLDDGLRAPDARRLSLRLFLDISREFDAHGYPALALEFANRGVVHAQEHLQMDDASNGRHLGYVQLMAMLGRYEEAHQVLLDLNDKIPNDDDVLGWLGIVAAMSGNIEAAERFSAMLRDLNDPYIRSSASFYRASIAAHLKRPDTALNLLRNAFSQGYPWGVNLHCCFELKPLRGHPEFESILHPEE